MTFYDNSTTVENTPQERRLHVKQLILHITQSGRHPISHTTQTKSRDTRRLTRKSEK